ncbi:hypothetical protein PISMIDRAFT_457133 [Pisolithus microcarpus 441]|uniref:Uncharacterized protein n=1 Tax=Pisolithus microcarpus 441 TaxID=765257 RepID=A0A0C9YPL4_9AGAM|nr:hypothetical protein PISMIDRAFT_457133 [Pisolithus microcarpus 441]
MRSRMSMGSWGDGSYTRNEWVGSCIHVTKWLRPPKRRENKISRRVRLEAST